jgi:16S rRNA processing protein RimM
LTSERRVAAGRVGRAHGRDGSFYVEDPGHPLAQGTPVFLGGRETRIERRGGTDQRPLVRVSGIHDRDVAASLSGELLLVAESESPLAEDEWLVEDLVGCIVEGLGVVGRVIAAPACDVLEVGEDGVLVPLVRDAIRRIDVESRVIEVDRRFLGMEEA